jgi:hypothetical protein
MTAECSASGERGRELMEMGYVEGKRALGSRASGGEGEHTVSEVSGRGITARHLGS